MNKDLWAELELEIEFRQTAEHPRGDCPLPEPGRDKIKIEHPNQMRIRPQPHHYDYDKAANNAELRRFRKSVGVALKDGEITREQALNLLSSVNI